MTTMRKIAITATIALLIVTIFVVTFYIGSHSRHTPSPPKVYKIKFQMGESLQSLQANSTYPIEAVGPPNMLAFGIMGNKAVILENTDSKNGYILPPSNFIIGGFKNNRLNDIDASPQLGVLNLNDSIVLIQHLTALFKKAGWCQSKSSGNTKVEDLAMFFQDKNRDNAGIMSWRNGTQFTQLYMRRAFTANEMRSYYPNDASQWQDRFRLNLSIGDYPKMPDYLEAQPCVDQVNQA